MPNIQIPVTRVDDEWHAAMIVDGKLARVYEGSPAEFMVTLLADVQAETNEFLIRIEFPDKVQPQMPATSPAVDL